MWRPRPQWTETVQKTLFPRQSAYKHQHPSSKHGIDTHEGEQDEPVIGLETVRNLESYIDAECDDYGTEGCERPGYREKSRPQVFRTERCGTTHFRCREDEGRSQANPSAS
jgi:hypothetical protein